MTDTLLFWAGTLSTEQGVSAALRLRTHIEVPVKAVEERR